MKVDVFGGIFFDINIYGEMHSSDIKSNPGGSGFNIALALSFLGNDVSLHGNIGNDYYGEIILNEMKKYSLKTDFIKKQNKNGIYVSHNDKPFAIERNCNEDNIFCEKNSDIAVITSEINKENFEKIAGNNYGLVFFDIGPRALYVKKHENIIKYFKNIFFIGNENENLIFKCNIVKSGSKGAYWDNIKISGNGINYNSTIGLGDIFDSSLINHFLKTGDKLSSLKNAVEFSESFFNEKNSYEKIISIKNKVV